MPTIDWPPPNFAAPPTPAQPAPFSAAPIPVFFPPAPATVWVVHEVRKDEFEGTPAVVACRSREAALTWIAGVRPEAESAPGEENLFGVEYFLEDVSTPCWQNLYRIKEVSLLPL